MRHVGHDLQRVPVSADLVAIELGLDGGLVDEVLRRAAAEHDRRGSRPPDHQVRRFDDVADDVDVAGAGLLLPRLREPHPDRRIRNRRTENRHVGAVGGRQDAVASGRFPEVPAEQMEKLPRGVRPRLERGGELGDPVVVRDELFLARVGVVDAIDAVVGQRGVVGVGRADVMALAAGFVQIVIEVRAGRDQAVDVAVEDQVGDDQAQAPRRQRARHAEKNRHVVLQHPLPDAVRRGEIASLKRNPLHAREHLIRAEPSLDGKRLDRRLQEPGFLLHARSIKS